MTDDELTSEELEHYERYLVAAHGMQAGVAMEMNYKSEPTSPKHLRVGVNSALVDIHGLVELLIEKGIFTKTEYIKHMADAMEVERKRYEDHISKVIGSKVTLR